MDFPETVARRRPRTRADYDDEDTPGMFPVTYVPVEAGVFNLYLFGPIQHSTQFIPFIEALNRAGQNDVVRIHLSTPGGSLDATDTFLTAMHECDARVIVHASGGVHSAGSIILLHADEFTLSDNFNMLIHNGSCGAGGDFNKFAAHATFSIRYMERVMQNTYEGFLSPEEIEAMIAGKDFWLDGEEFAGRWQARNEYMEAKYDALKAMRADQPAADVTTKRKRTKAA